MFHLFDWLVENKEWVFSGFGVVVLTGITSHVVQKSSKNQETASPELESLLIFLKEVRAENKQFRLKKPLREAIRKVPKLTPEQLNMLSCLFVLKNLTFSDLCTIDDADKRVFSIAERYDQLLSKFGFDPEKCKSDAKKWAAVILKLKEYRLLRKSSDSPADMADILNQRYNVDLTAFDNYDEIFGWTELFPADYGLTPGGQVLAMIYAHTQLNLSRDLLEWLQTTIK